MTLSVTPALVKGLATHVLALCGESPAKVKRAQLLESIAKACGFANYNALKAALDAQAQPALGLPKSLQPTTAAHTSDNLAPQTIDLGARPEAAKNQPYVLIDSDTLAVIFERDPFPPIAVDDLERPHQLLRLLRGAMARMPHHSVDNALKNQTLDMLFGLMQYFIFHARWEEPLLPEKSLSFSSAWSNETGNLLMFFDWLLRWRDATKNFAKPSLLFFSKLHKRFEVFKNVDEKNARHLVLRRMAHFWKMDNTLRDKVLTHIFEKLPDLWTVIAEEAYCLDHDDADRLFDLSDVLNTFYHHHVPNWASFFKKGFDRDTFIAIERTLNQGGMVFLHPPKGHTTKDRIDLMADILGLLPPSSKIDFLGAQKPIDKAFAAVGFDNGTLTRPMPHFVFANDVDISHVAARLFSLLEQGVGGVVFLDDTGLIGLYPAIHKNSARRANPAEFTAYIALMVRLHHEEMVEQGKSPHRLMTKFFDVELAQKITLEKTIDMALSPESAHTWFTERQIPEWLFRTPEEVVADQGPAAVLRHIHESAPHEIA